MTDRELMQQALEALDYEAECGNDDAYHPLRAALRERLAQPEMQPCAGRNCGSTNPNLHSAECFEDYEKATGMAQPEQEPVAWKLMPRDATDSMLKAMDECSTEGYDERLYAGHAASVYMAAWDEAPETIPKKKWVGLTEEEHTQIAINAGCMSADWVFYGAAIERKLREKNTHD